MKKILTGLMPIQVDSVKKAHLEAWKLYKTVKYYHGNNHNNN